MFYGIQLIRFIAKNAGYIRVSKMRGAGMRSVKANWIIIMLSIVTTYAIGYSTEKLVQKANAGWPARQESNL